MNQPFRPPSNICTCGCTPCQCQGFFVDERLLESWRQVAAFKRMLEDMIAQIGTGQGPPGPQGPEGPAGPQGAAGQQGPQGPAGANGAAGPAGPPGLGISYVGPTPPANPEAGWIWLDTTDDSLHIYDGTNWVDFTGGGSVPGPAGPAGPAGAMGPQGPEGTPGPVGPAGPQGAQGAVGATGATGQQGTAGTAGAAGPQGPAGTIGPQGPAGNMGAQGPAGTAGPQGPAGVQGPVGPAGTASLTIGAIGTYAFSWPMNSTTLPVGTTTSGTNVMPSMAGTWQICSYFKNAGNMNVYLLQRIS